MSYVFDPDIVHACSMQAIGKPKPEMFDVFADAMERHYPGILDRGQPWLYSIAGGAMIQMKLYYASFNEYIMIWGTPIGSEGHSGRHRVGFWDTVLDGECWYYAEGEFERRVYRPGDRIYVGPGQACGMNFTDGVWAVEYARGPIPLSIPFGLADVLLSTVDVKTAAQTLTLYADLTMQAAGQKLPVVQPAANLIANVARRLTRWMEPRPTLPAIPKDNPEGWYVDRAA